MALRTFALRAFRPHPLLTIIALILVALTLKLAVWQFDRAEQKRALETAAVLALSATPVPLRQPQPVHPFQRAAVVGHYQPQQEILLDNRVYQRRAGYHVVTPFILAEGGAVMVQRGWIAGDGSRAIPDVPQPATVQMTVQGVFYTDEASAFRLSETLEQGTVRQYLNLQTYAEESGLALMSLVLIKEAAADDLLTVTALRTDYKSNRSTIYAWQWLTFCLLTVVFYCLLAFRKK
ncbi:MAG: SURF1 family protein [Proteobacteria bacterium]|nr:SURF1 family protein [Pseudomonadota bacterium]